MPNTTGKNQLSTGTVLSKQVLGSAQLADYPYMMTALLLSGTLLAGSQHTASQQWQQLLPNTPSAHTLGRVQAKLSTLSAPCSFTDQQLTQQQQQQPMASTTTKPVKAPQP